MKKQLLLSIAFTLSTQVYATQTTTPRTATPRQVTNEQVANAVKSMKSSLEGAYNAMAEVKNAQSAFNRVFNSAQATFDHSISAENSIINSKQTAAQKAINNAAHSFLYNGQTLDTRMVQDLEQITIFTNALVKSINPTTGKVGMTPQAFMDHYVTHALPRLQTLSMLAPLLTTLVHWIHATLKEIATDTAKDTVGPASNAGTKQSNPQ